MAFWEGVRKIISGVEEIASTPGELLANLKYKRRVALSGKYTVHIPAENKNPSLIAHITFNGGANTHDVDLITYSDGTVDVWDKLSGSTIAHVQCKINSFLYNLMDKNGANPYR
jgi:hypothetical protein